VARLVPYFNEEKFFWLARSDLPESWHCEASDELIREWEQAGKLNP